jgi:hypothetical protein
MVLVTQRTRGQLAVVDLTGGQVVDEDLSTPGINLIPVGADPTDVVVTPDLFLVEGDTAVPSLVFVASAATNQPAIYSIPSSKLLGDSMGLDAQPPELTSFAACSLPQPPQALGVATATSGGDAGGPAYVVVVLLRAFLGAPAQIVTVDPRPFSTTIQPGTLPPCTILGQAPFSGAVPATGLASAWPDGVVYADAGDLQANEPPLGPSCASPGSVGNAMAGAAGGGDSGALEAGAPDAGAAVDAGPAMVEEAAGDDSGAADAGDATAEAAASNDSGGPDAAGATPGGGDAGPAVGAGQPAFGAGVLVPPVGPPQPTAMVLRDDAPIAYVADESVPLIHVLDLTDPASPREIGQFVATSVANPSRQVQVGGLALSPTTSDLRRYLYAIDMNAGTLMVFDATSPTPQTPAQTPLLRPHAELNPFVPPDRLSFSAPVATMTFALHDWPLVPPSPNTDEVHAYTGLLCNPNPNAAGSLGGTFVDGGLGGYYRTDEVAVIQPQGSGVEGWPVRLRGVFGFVTLSNGAIVVVDVDDWDAPCRRPDPMNTVDGGPAFQLGVLDVPEPAPLSADDLDPYHAPSTVLTYDSNTGVTQEVFFPVSAPNRMRSEFLLRNDPTSGEHEPYVSVVPQLYDSTGAVVSYTSGGTAALILPTALSPGFADPAYIENPTAVDLEYTYISTPLATASGQAGAGAAVLFPGAAATVPGVRVSLDDPTAHIDQDWSVTYEGVLPTANGIFADIASADGSYETLTFAPAPASEDAGASNGADFCERGIEDWNTGRLRASAALDAMTAAGLSPPSYVQNLAQWSADYIEITDDLLAPGDPYWSLPVKSPSGGLENPCWQGLTVIDGTALDDDAAPSIANERYNACFQTYNSASNDDSNYTRDFPILQATDNALVVGRFAWPTSTDELPTNRTIVGPDPSNVPYLRLATCCFHHQAGFKVRAGGEWVTTGQIGQNPGVGLLNHVVAQPGTGACVVNCNDPTQALLNARSFEVPPPLSACNPAMSNGSLPLPIDRNSVLAMRNPMLSFVMWGGCPPLNATDGGAVDAQGDHTFSARDQHWQFSLRGGFTPESVALQGTSGTPVSPQSMLYIAPFEQLAVVDGAQNGPGLVVIDVNTLGFAHAPYF